MGDWYWVLTALLGAVGLLLFGLSSRRYRERGRSGMTGGDVAVGLAGLGLAAWAAVLAGIGLVVQVAEVLTR